jgi:hypothetical protein
MVSKKKIARTVLTLLKYWAVTSLLFLYLIGSSNLESLHSFIHEHEVTFLTKKHETDNNHCEIRLHYQNLAGGCDHDIHFIKEDKCSLCDIQFSNSQIAEFNIITLQDTFCDVFSSNSYEHNIEGIDFQYLGRAPPVS